jgi:predicted DsbA family dithiol-disulfide isomerase
MEVLDVYRSKGVIMSNPTNVEVYIDYVCPWAYRGSLWIRDVKAQLGDQIEIVWKFFSLEQVNSQAGDDWKVWNQPASHMSKGFIGFRGAIAARQQGEDAFEKFHFAWFEARHSDQRRASAHDVAQAVGLDMEKFNADFDNPELYKQLGVDHEQGVSEFGVFGTPTYVFENGENAYFQIKEIPASADAVPFWEKFSDIVVNQPSFLEIKRPYPSTAH